MVLLDVNNSMQKPNLASQLLYSYYVYIYFFTFTKIIFYKNKKNGESEPCGKKGEKIPGNTDALKCTQQRC